MNGSFREHLLVSNGRIKEITLAHQVKSKHCENIRGIIFILLVKKSDSPLYPGQASPFIPGSFSPNKSTSEPPPLFRPLYSNFNTANLSTQQVEF